jgi:hypothetical protein
MEDEVDAETSSLRLLCRRPHLASSQYLTPPLYLVKRHRKVNVRRDMVLRLGPPIPVQIAACQADLVSNSAGDSAHGIENLMSILVDCLTVDSQLLSQLGFGRMEPAESGKAHKQRW